MNYETRKILASTNYLGLQQQVLWEVLSDKHVPLEYIINRMKLDFAKEIVAKKWLGHIEHEDHAGKVFEMKLYVHDRAEILALLDEAYMAGYNKRAEWNPADFDPGKNPCSEIPLTGPTYSTLRPEPEFNYSPKSNARKSNARKHYSKMYTQELKDADTRPMPPPEMSPDRDLDLNREYPYDYIPPQAYGSQNNPLVDKLSQP